MLEKILLIDRFTRATGRAVRWLSLLMVICSCLVVLLRYAFGIPSIALQETVMYLHASIFMLGAAYTWQQGGHVRVDVFYRTFQRRTQQRIDRFGIVLLLLPVCLFMLYSSWSYVALAWSIGEKSQEAGGLPFVYLLKTLILIMPLLMILQALAEFARTFLPDSEQTDPENPTEVHHG
ncbi:TRAP transporter small permease subunit [Bacterioplanoides pacificum]|uniref:TRAP transporter small permease protein n=1 Tax=Bacterioplanoides pacificum TaxID=1171596 RepID=A0ABV7VT44_9GAMM